MKNHDDMSDAATSKIQGRARSQKRVKQAKDTKHNEVETPSTYSLNVLHHAIAATSSGSMQESEEIPIHEYLTLRTIGSKVMYYIAFSQESLPEPSGTSQRQGIAKSISSSSDRRDSERLPMQKPAMIRPVRNLRFSPKRNFYCS
jgi:hypothetical protein